MSAKNTKETLTIKCGDKELVINASIIYGRSGVTEKVEYKGKVGKYRYSNRPWQSMTYDNALHDLASQLGGVEEKAICDWVDETLGRKRKESEEFISSFKAAHDMLSDKQKKALQGVHVETKEQANELLAVVRLGALLNSVAE